MSQTYDPNYAEHGQGYLAGPGYPGGAGYTGGYAGAGFASEPPPPPRRNHKRGLILTGAVALAAGAAAGGLIGGLHRVPAGTATATSKTVLSASQIAERVDPALVDIVSTDGYQQASSAGTGIVLTSNGEVLTNNHVIEGATSIKVTDVGNGRTYAASVVGYDKSDDIAVLQLKNASGLTTVSLGDSSQVKSGDKVVALGNAGGKGGAPSVAAGKVTALNQAITASDEGGGSAEHLTGMIETNANIQPGDSGGALVNAAGQVVGINTAASTASETSSGSQSPDEQWPFGGSQTPSGQQTSSGSSQTQGFAIPINRALAIADQIETGHASDTVHIGATGFLGVEFASQSSFAGGGQGSTSATISGVLPGSPGARAGLAAGDVIDSVGGHAVSSPDDLSSVIQRYHPGDKVTVTWTNEFGQTSTSTVVLTTGPAD